MADNPCKRIVITLDCCNSVTKMSELLIAAASREGMSFRDSK